MKKKIKPMSKIRKIMIKEIYLETKEIDKKINYY